MKHFEFKHKFEFDLSLKKLVGDFFAGWDIYVNVSDINDNFADKKDHLSSVIGALLDAIKDAIMAFIDMIWEWFKENVVKLFEKVLKSIISPIISGVKSLAENLDELYNLLYTDSDSGSRDGFDIYSTICKVILIFSIPICLVIGLISAIETGGTALTGSGWKVLGLTLIPVFHISISAIMHIGNGILVGGMLFGLMSVIGSDTGSDTERWLLLVEFGSAWIEGFTSLAEFVFALLCGLTGIIWATLSLVLSCLSLVFCLISNIKYKTICTTKERLDTAAFVVAGLGFLIAIVGGFIETTAKVLSLIYMGLSIGIATLALTVAFVQWTGTMGWR